MNCCVKCGKEISKGELFCLECSLNPGTPLYEPPRPVERPATVKKKKPVPKPVHRVAVKPEKKKKKGSKLRLALILVSVALVLSLGYIYWEHDNLQAQKNNLETREAHLQLLEQKEQELQEELDALLAEQEQLRATIADKDGQIEELSAQLSGSQSSQNQSAYDLTTAMAEIQRLEAENKELLLLESELETRIKTLEKAKAKADFMDRYVVFVENNGSNTYHTYDCEKFSKSNFWAYSRSLAKSYGFTACPTCGGMAQ